MNYIEQARRRFPDATTIQGDGRWAVGVEKNGTVKVVYLCVDERQQKSVALGCEKPVLEDLQPRYVPTRCSNIGYDREERRRERQEKAEQ